MALIIGYDRMRVRQANYHQRGESIMAQGVLPYKYEGERNDAGMTALAGLPIYLDLASVLGVADCIGAHGFRYRCDSDTNEPCRGGFQRPLVTPP